MGHNGAGNRSAYDFKRLVITDYYRGVDISLTCQKSRYFIYSSNPQKSTGAVDPVLDMS